MNEADFPSINLDELRLVPDWMREGTPTPSKQYASHDGPSDYDSRPSSRGPRQGQGTFGRDSRGGGGGGDRRRDAGRPGPGGTRGGPRRDSRPGEQRPRRDEAPPARPAAPAPVQVVFQPDDHCLASIIKQIRSTHLAYPLFSLARMFLQEPARHWVQFTVEPAASQSGTVLYQLGDEGPVTLDRATLERIAFDSAREQYYTEQTIQKEPLKGNFANVARERTSGTLLGPTNHHGYQPALRALYESRFSRRMSFEDYRRNVEVVSDPALVERWKEEARTVTTIVTKEGEPPTTLQTVADARAHFRQHYFDGLVKSGNVRRVHGSVARNLPDEALMQAIRQAHETEIRYPAHFVQLLREGLQNAGLHIFKHRKRVVYVSLARPIPFVAAGSAVSENVAAILDVIGKFPLCTRKVIAEHTLAKSVKNPAPTPVAAAGEVQAVATEPAEAGASNTALPTDQAPVAPDDTAAKAKGALAADLRFLVQAGHIIEFHNGTFDLPLPPKTKEESAAPARSKAEKVIEEIGADPANSAPSPAASATQVEEPSTPDDPAVAEPVEQPASAASVPETQSEDAGLSDEPELSAQPATSAHDPGVSSEPLP